MRRDNFGEFMEYLPKCLKPIKIQTEYKMVFFSDFLIQIVLGF
jgi:hypothetical protein